jgi:hypothetical protein
MKFSIFSFLKEKNKLLWKENKEPFLKTFWITLVSEMKSSK